MDKIFVYLGLINILGLVLYILYKNLGTGILKNILTLILYLLGICGGSLGLILAILIFDRNTAKDGLSLKVFAFASFVIELVLFLLFRKDMASLSFDFVGFFEDKPYLLIYLGLINLISFLAFGFDKNRANRNKRRLKNGFLLGLSFIGGSIGGLIGMKVFRHKTEKAYYKMGLPLMILMQVLLLILIMNT
ncbi:MULTISPECIES: DUF1294 domain-containing protein [Anaerococcus]|uniref:DUF1294 domain-containing protein n=1 Tax=Anaerococcus kampingae TaxID=3115614 RepID=A0ABW9MDX1_9FIRM|nr:DUF1294 domain-containing protein [Anaerococcus sp. Marseille-P3915]